MKFSQGPKPAPLQLWGGVECTINRVGDQYIEQLERSGHTQRISDLAKFKALGVTALRHPILWEHTAPEGLENARWDWADVSLKELQQLRIRPIVGLLHHGSGPRCTSLLDPEFAQQLSAYAHAVACRYPWVDDYTPVNEPLTTARFSALYGHWYPHRKDDLSFAQALLNQCRAVVLCMRAIRNVNPVARLIQTDDLGKVFSTPAMAYQADFENERRWCGFDILCGRVDRSHPMWQYFVWAGIDAKELEWFRENPCPPDVIGTNHYLSGERFLDEQVERYPGDTHGGNGRWRYADSLAARVLEKGPAGPRALLMEAWERYRLPIAITECHNGCTREEQLRWFLEVWRAAEECIRDGASVLAVTSWSLLGAFDWNDLARRNQGRYECGAYDIRFADPRPTALVPLIRSLAAGQAAEPPEEHPILQVPGWWKRDQRFVYGFSVDENGQKRAVNNRAVNNGYPSSHVRPVLITGGSGTLATAFARICSARGISHRVLSRQQLDIGNPNSVHKALFALQPWALINAAGYVRVDDAERDPSRCFRENTEGPRILANECLQRNIKLLTFSSDLVFGESDDSPNVESDAPNPMNCYGVSKAEAEKLVLGVMPSTLVVRTSAFFGPWDGHNFVVNALRDLNAKRHFLAAADTTVSPTYVPDLVNVCLDLLIDGESGIWHLANHGAVSWARLAEQAAIAAGISTETLQECKMRDFNLAAKRPAYSVLASERAILLPSLDDALGRFVRECGWESTQDCPDLLVAQ